MRFCWIVIFFVLLNGLYAAFSDLHLTCSDISYGKLLVNVKSTPYGNLSAGHYNKVKDAETLPNCVEACCEDDRCNVAFFFNTTCYSIQCHSYKACKPLKRFGKKFEKSYVVVVRLPDIKYIYEDDFTGTEGEKSFADDFYHDEDMDDDNIKDSAQPFLDQSISTTVFHSPPPKSCIYGIGNECLQHEECVPKNNRARSGMCHCKEGYERNFHGYCKKKRMLTNTAQQVTVPSSGVSNIQEPPVSRNNTEKLASTTISPVHQLVVSAGDNVTLQLPENEVTLSAYALKQPEVSGEGDNFKYEWTLISHPEGDETGTMQDQNTKNLKLSKLRAGLYTFKVTVSSSNAVGEAMVNVTVLPLVIITESGKMSKAIIFESIEEAQKNERCIVTTYLKKGIDARGDRGKPATRQSTSKSAVLPDIRFDSTQNIIGKRKKQQRCPYGICNSKPRIFCPKCDATLCVQSFPLFHKKIT